MKEFSKTKPRLVVYVSAEEMKAAKTLATSSGLKSANRWAGATIRKALNRK